MVHLEPFRDRADECAVERHMDVAKNASPPRPCVPVAVVRLAPCPSPTWSWKRPRFHYEVYKRATSRMETLRFDGFYGNHRH